MRQISLREFRTRGTAALAEVPATETVLLSGQQGPAYFLVPVLGDVASEDRELRRAIAKASLRQNWTIAKEQKPAVSDEDIQQEIVVVRNARSGRRKK